MSNINQEVNRLVTSICRKEGLMKKELAEKLGTSDIALSLTLSPNANTITTKKLNEIATALNRKLVIGLLTDDEIDYILNNNSVLPGPEMPEETLLKCPTCGSMFKLVPVEEHPVDVHPVDEHLNIEFAICNPAPSDVKEKRKEMVEKMKHTREQKQQNAE